MKQPEERDLQSQMELLHTEKPQPQEDPQPSQDMQDQPQQEAPLTQQEEPVLEEEEEEEDPVQEEDFLFEIEFRVRERDYVEFQEDFSRKNVKAAIKRSRIIGAVEIAVGILIGIFTFLDPNSREQYLIYIFPALLMIMGIWNIFSSRKSSWKTLRKNASRSYFSAAYLQHPLQIRFYADRFQQIAQGFTREFYWKDIHSFRENRHQFFILVKEKSCVLIPKKDLGDNEQKVAELIDKVCEVYGKKKYKIRNEEQYI